ncbi:hypothetical protein [Chlamydia felis Fe/C-56]|uniref:Uncharacterized protein n=1 Tax=Chlamydia felis (strain Fe/C-56) TaxID=264202 RepID=Q255Q5_CHLFF|nr:hypothetical protein [Chlamydia felis Fe/C-56]
MESWCIVNVNHERRTFVIIITRLCFSEMFNRGVFPWDKKLKRHNLEVMRL